MLAALPIRLVKSSVQARRVGDQLEQITPPGGSTSLSNTSAKLAQKRVAGACWGEECRGDWRSRFHRIAPGRRGAAPRLARAPLHPVQALVPAPRRSSCRSPTDLRTSDPRIEGRVGPGDPRLFSHRSTPSNRCRNAVRACRANPGRMRRSIGCTPWRFHSRLRTPASGHASR